MRPRLRMTLLAALIAVAAGAASAAPARTSGAGAIRNWPERMAAPAQFDLSLAQISFGAHAKVASESASRHPGTLGLTLPGPTGLDYVAGAITRFSVLGRPRALVLVVNRRPRGSLAADLARIAFTVRSPARLGDPLLLQVSNPFTRPTGLTPALCDLPIHGAALAGADLRAVLSRGPALGGFSAAVAIAQAYDAACGRPFSEPFKLAVSQRSAAPCQTPAATICCQPNATCLPPPCPPCPCGSGPCPVPVAAAREAAIACPLQIPPVACPL